MYKTYSSPNLREKTTRRFKRYNNDDNDVDDGGSQFVIGDRVLVDKYRAGSVAFFGELDFSSGDWVGVVLDEPSGNHDGKIHGREYFHCAPQHGLFVRPSRLRKIETFSSLQSSRSATPLGSKMQQSRSSLQSPASTMSPTTSTSQTPANSGRSTTESYYYDDDYRNYPSRPSIESLERKLRSINATTPKKQSDQYVNLRPRAQSASSSPTRIISKNYNYDYNHKPTSETVFNFRPQRIRVDDYARESPEVASAPSSNLSRTPSYSMGKLLDFSTNKPLHLHDRILVKSVERQCELKGTLRYLGQTNFATGEWAGVELDDPEGRNDGTVLGVRYFTCPENYGLFVPATRVSRLSPKADFASSVKSTIKSPPPPLRSESQNSMESPVTSFSNHRACYTPSAISVSSASSPSPNNRQQHANNSYIYDREGYHIPKYTNDSYRGNIPYDVDMLATPIRSSSSAYSSSNLSSSSPPAATKLKEFDLDNALKHYTTRRRPKLNNLYSDDYCNNISSNETNSEILGNQSSNYRSRPRSIKYTFKSSKYDGNPIAVKTVEYDDPI